jgi:hypothetical protein
MHEENSNGEEGVVRKRCEREFLRVRHWKNGAKPMIDQPTMN